MHGLRVDGLLPRYDYTTKVTCRLRVSGKQNIVMTMNVRIPQYQAFSKQGGDKLINIRIDVHKRKCVATFKDSSLQILQQVTFDNDSRDITEFTDSIKQRYDNARTVCESTDNYWIRLYDTLEENGIDTLLAHPANTFPWQTSPMNLPMITCSMVLFSLAAAFCNVVKCGMVLMPASVQYLLTHAAIQQMTRRILTRIA